MTTETRRPLMIRTANDDIEILNPDDYPNGVLVVPPGVQIRHLDFDDVCGVRHPRLIAVSPCAERGRHPEHRGTMADEYGTVVTWGSGKG